MALLGFMGVERDYTVYYCHGGTPPNGGDWNFNEILPDGEEELRLTLRMEEILEVAERGLNGNHIDATAAVAAHIIGKYVLTDRAPLPGRPIPGAPDNRRTALSRLSDPII